jgi:hypothetical protein
MEKFISWDKGPEGKRKTKSKLRMAAKKLSNSSVYAGAMMGQARNYRTNCCSLTHLQFMIVIIQSCDLARFIILTAELLVFILQETVSEHLLMSFLELIHENVMDLATFRNSLGFVLCCCCC